MPRVMVNPAGRKVVIPDEWENLYPQLWNDLRDVDFITYNPDSPEPPQLFIERSGGGFGDVVHMLSAVEDRAISFKQKYPNGKMMVSVPESQLFFLDQLKPWGIEIVGWNWVLTNLNYQRDVLDHSRNHYDLHCPCMIYEAQSNYEVKKSRVELFYETLEQPNPRPPQLRLANRIPSPFKGAKKGVVGLGLRSTERWRDWSLERWKEVADILVKKGYMVVTFDTKLTLPGIPGVVGRTFSEVMHMIDHCDVFLNVDSGLTYVAAALGVTTIGLYGETKGSTLLERHYLDGHAIQIIRPDHCKRPCYLKRGFYCDKVSLPDTHAVCMFEISPRMVINKFEQLEATQGFKNKKFKEVILPWLQSRIKQDVSLKSRQRFQQSGTSFEKAPAQSSTAQRKSLSS